MQVRIRTTRNSSLRLHGSGSDPRIKPDLEPADKKKPDPNLTPKKFAPGSDHFYSPYLLLNFFEQNTLQIPFISLTKSIDQVL